MKSIFLAWLCWIPGIPDSFWTLRSKTIYAVSKECFGPVEEETPKLTQATWDLRGRESEVFENIGKQQIIILQSVCNIYTYILFGLDKKTYIQYSYVDLGQKAMCSKVLFSMMFPKLH